MSEGYRNIEWREHNATRNYPFDVTADKVSTDTLFEIKNNVLIGAYFYISTTRNADLSGFYVSEITNVPAYLKLTISYSSSATPTQIVGTVQIDRATHTHGRTYAISASTGWSELTGYLVVDELPTEYEPLGTFTFTQDATRFDTDTVRPSLHGLSAIQIVQADGTIDSLSGNVNLVPGTNVRFDVEQSAAGSFTLQVNAISGEGLNQTCECGDELPDPIRSINGIPGDAAGNIDLIGSRCLTVEAEDTIIAIANPCSEPCCGCEEAEQLTQAILPIANRAASLVNTVSDLKTSVNQLSLMTDMYSLDTSCPSPKLPDGVGVTTTTTVDPGTTTTTAPTTTTTTQSPSLVPFTTHVGASQAIWVLNKDNIRTHVRVPGHNVISLAYAPTRRRYWYLYYSDAAPDSLRLRTIDIAPQAGNSLEFTFTEINDVAISPERINSSIVYSNIMETSLAPTKCFLHTNTTINAVSTDGSTASSVYTVPSGLRIHGLGITSDDQHLIWQEGAPDAEVADVYYSLVGSSLGGKTRLATNVPIGTNFTGLLTSFRFVSKTGSFCTWNLDPGGNPDGIITYRQPSGQPGTFRHTVLSSIMRPNGLSYATVFGSGDIPVIIEATLDGQAYYKNYDRNIDGGFGVNYITSPIGDSTWTTSTTTTTTTTIEPSTTTTTTAVPENVKFSQVVHFGQNGSIIHVFSGLIEGSQVLESYRVQTSNQNVHSVYYDPTYRRYHYIATDTTPGRPWNSVSYYELNVGGVPGDNNILPSSLRYTKTMEVQAVPSVPLPETWMVQWKSGLSTVTGATGHQDGELWYFSTAGIKYRRLNESTSVDFSSITYANASKIYGCGALRIAGSSLQVPVWLEVEPGQTTGRLVAGRITWPTISTWVFNPLVLSNNFPIGDNFSGSLNSSQDGVEVLFFTAVDEVAGGTKFGSKVKVWEPTGDNSAGPSGTISDYWDIVNSDTIGLMNLDWAPVTNAGDGYDGSLYVIPNVRRAILSGLVKYEGVISNVYAARQTAYDSQFLSQIGVDEPSAIHVGKTDYRVITGTAPTTTTTTTTTTTVPPISGAINADVFVGATGLVTVVMARPSVTAPVVRRTIATTSNLRSEMLAFSSHDSVLFVYGRDATNPNIRKIYAYELTGIIEGQSLERNVIGSIDITTPHDSVRGLVYSADQEKTFFLTSTGVFEVTTGGMDPVELSANLLTLSSGWSIQAGGVTSDDDGRYLLLAVYNNASVAPNRLMSLDLQEALPWTFGVSGTVDTVTLTTRFVSNASQLSGTRSLVYFARHDTINVASVQRYFGAWYAGMNGGEITQLSRGVFPPDSYAGCGSYSESSDTMGVFGISPNNLFKTDETLAQVIDQRLGLLPSSSITVDPLRTLSIAGGTTTTVAPPPSVRTFVVYSVDRNKIWLLYPDNTVAYCQTPANFEYYDIVKDPSSGDRQNVVYVTGRDLATSKYVLRAIEITGEIARENDRLVELSWSVIDEQDIPENQKPLALALATSSDRLIVMTAGHVMAIGVEDIGTSGEFTTPGGLGGYSGWGNFWSLVTAATPVELGSNRIQQFEAFGLIDNGPRALLYAKKYLLNLSSTTVYESTVYDINVANVYATVVTSTSAHITVKRTSNSFSEMMTEHWADIEGSGTDMYIAHTATQYVMLDKAADNRCSYEDSYTAPDGGARWSVDHAVDLYDTGSGKLIVYGDAIQNKILGVAIGSSSYCDSDSVVHYSYNPNDPAHNLKVTDVETGSLSVANGWTSTTTTTTTTEPGTTTTTTTTTSTTTTQPPTTFFTENSLFYTTSDNGGSLFGYVPSAAGTNQRVELARNIGTIVAMTVGNSYIYVGTSNGELKKYGMYPASQGTLVATMTGFSAIRGMVFVPSEVHPTNGHRIVVADSVGFHWVAEDLGSKLNVKIRSGIQCVDPILLDRKILYSANNSLYLLSATHSTSSNPGLPITSHSAPFVTVGAPVSLSHFVYGGQYSDDDNRAWLDLTIYAAMSSGDVYRTTLESFKPSQLEGSQWMRVSEWGYAKDQYQKIDPVILPNGTRSLSVPKVKLLALASTPHNDSTSDFMCIYDSETSTLSTLLTRVVSGEYQGINYQLDRTSEFKVFTSGATGTTATVTAVCSMPKLGPALGGGASVNTGIITQAVRSEFTTMRTADRTRYNVEIEGPLNAPSQIGLNHGHYTTYGRVLPIAYALNNASVSTRSATPETTFRRQSVLFGDNGLTSDVSGFRLLRPSATLDQPRTRTHVTQDFVERHTYDMTAGAGGLYIKSGEHASATLDAAGVISSATVLGQYNGKIVLSVSASAAARPLVGKEFVFVNNGFNLTTTPNGTPDSTLGIDKSFKVLQLGTKLGFGVGGPSTLDGPAVVIDCSYTPELAAWQSGITLNPPPPVSGVLMEATTDLYSVVTVARDTPYRVSLYVRKVGSAGADQTIWAVGTPIALFGSSSELCNSVFTVAYSQAVENTDMVRVYINSKQSVNSAPFESTSAADWPKYVYRCGQPGVGITSPLPSHAPILDGRTIRVANSGSTDGEYRFARFWRGGYERQGLVQRTIRYEANMRLGGTSEFTLYCAGGRTPGVNGIGFRSIGVRISSAFSNTISQNIQLVEMTNNDFRVLAELGTIFSSDADSMFGNVKALNRWLNIWLEHNIYTGQVSAGVGVHGTNISRRLAIPYTSDVWGTKYGYIAKASGSLSATNFVDVSELAATDYLSGVVRPLGQFNSEPGL